MDNMIITMAKYTRDADTDEILGLVATIDNKDIIVPVDPANRHYAAIKAKHDDVDDSFTIQDAD